jgi:hypothetical protein
MKLAESRFHLDRPYRRGLLTLVLIVTLGVVGIAGQRPGRPRNVRVKPGNAAADTVNAGTVKTDSVKKDAVKKAAIENPKPDQPVHLHVAHALAPDASVTAKAVKSGTWSDPSTWGGKLPGEWARIAIPAGLTVTLDGAFGPYQWVRADGKLRTDPTRNTGLELDSLFVNHDGGSFEVPCTPPDKSAAIVFRAYQNAPIDKAWDFTENSRGLVGEGPVTLCGAEKTPFVTVSNLPAKGASAITADTDVQGWTPGDHVVLTSGKYGEDEARQIASVSGKVVTLTAALNYNHAEAVPKGEVLHLANLTRNVRITSAVANDLTRHGHVMLMGTGHEIRYVEFADVGRTNLKPPTDPLVLPDGKQDPQLFPLCGGAVENVRGRYPLHFHRAGPASIPSIVEGVVVRALRNSGVRWGIVNHSSNVHVRKTVVHQIDGSQFVTEEGDEVGTFENNLAIYSRGGGGALPGQPGDGLCMKENYPELNARRRNSLGHRGIGFWLQGGGVIVRGSIASGHQEMFAIDSASLSRNHSNTYIVRFPQNLLRGDKSWVNRATLDIGDVPALLEVNLGYAGSRTEGGNDAALTFLHHGMKTLERYPNAPKTLIKGFRAWNVRRGMVAQYTGNVRFEDVSIESGSYGTGPGTIGVQMAAQGGHAFQFVNVGIKGFAKPILRSIGPGSTCENVTVDGKPLDCTPFIKTK